MIPCKDCLCVPRCRYKEYYYMLSECSIIRKFLYSSSRVMASTRVTDYNKLIVQIEEHINPRYWETTELKYQGHHLEIYGKNLSEKGVFKLNESSL
jgi:hypothetical protein